jgi:hypothetical protein
MRIDKETKIQLDKAIDSQPFSFPFIWNVCVIMWWDLFQPKKIYEFLKGIRNGKSFHFAYLDAKYLKTK